LLRPLAAQATMAMTNVTLHYDVQRRAITDDLTGLATHGHFQDLLGAEMEEARRYHYAVGLIMLDIAIEALQVGPTARASRNAQHHHQRRGGGIVGWQQERAHCGRRQRPVHGQARGEEPEDHGRSGHRSRGPRRVGFGDGHS
jgi:hypothetical protein